MNSSSTQNPSTHRALSMCRHDSTRNRTAGTLCTAGGSTCWRSHIQKMDAMCRKCKRRHYPTVSQSVIPVLVEWRLQTQTQRLFWEPWEKRVTASLNGTPVHLYIDSGAKLTVISESVWRSLGSTTPFLISTSTRKIHLCLIFTWAVQVATGMEHLHNRDIIHQNLNRPSY